MCDFVCFTCTIFILKFIVHIANVIRIKLLLIYLLTYNLFFVREVWLGHRVLKKAWRYAKPFWERSALRRNCGSIYVVYCAFIHWRAVIKFCRHAAYVERSYGGFVNDVCVTAGPTEVKVGMYINHIAGHGRASFQTVVCRCHSK